MINFRGLYQQLYRQISPVTISTHSISIRLEKLEMNCEKVTDLLLLEIGLIKPRMGWDTLVVKLEFGYT